MHADYLLAAATMAEAERRAAERSRYGSARRRGRRYRLARLARGIAPMVRRLDPLPPLEAAPRPLPPVAEPTTVRPPASAEGDTPLDRCA